jgi:NOL1/NOP2/sun family putative RNA methylase
MSGKEFFLHRYKRLGWTYEGVRLEQAIRINTMNAQQERVIERLRQRGVKLEKITYLRQGYWVRSKFSVGATAEYLLGLYSTQEAAAQIPATLFSDLSRRKVLDACAAPGGKTVQLADLMMNDGVIVALDVRKQRLMALANQLERCRVRNTVVYDLDARRVSRLDRKKFDRILLDMPCSGNFAADKAWFRNRTLTDVERNAKLQREILAEATRVISEDGEVVYSTCSLEPEEDELNIDWAVRSLKLEVEEVDCCGQEALTNVFGKRLDSSVSRARRIWPGRTQGFFVCKLRRRKHA